MSPVSKSIHHHAYCSTISTLDICCAFRSGCKIAAFIVSTCRGQEDLQHVRHGDQMQDVHVIVGGADGRWLQVDSLLLVQRGKRQHQPDLKKYTGTFSPKARNLFN